MRFTVWDVGHGSCIEAVAQNRSIVLFDCGSSDTWQPHRQFKSNSYTGIEMLVVSNYDEDHIGDLPNIRQHFKIDYLLRNTSISATQLRALKLETCGEVSVAMSHMLHMMGNYTTAGGASYVGATVHPGITLRHFWNRFGEFNDTNNLSVVTVVEMGGEKFIVPGDMERAGWDVLLKRADFQSALAGTTVLVASHHGRASGFHADIFKYIRPKVVVMSDDVKQYETQEMAKVYGKFATGVQFKGETRYVLTTRNDGSLNWNF